MIRAPLAASEMVTSTVSTATALRRVDRLGRDAFGLTVTTGTSRPPGARTVQPPAKHRLGGRPVGGEVDGVGDQARAEPDGEPARDLLALRARGEQDAAPAPTAAATWASASDFGATR